MALHVALAIACNDDAITLLPSGSPYQTFPGPGISGKHLTIRVSTGNPADVVLDGAGLDIVLELTNRDGTVIEHLTIRNRTGYPPTNSSGAGLKLNSSAVTIRNCVISGNSNRVIDPLFTNAAACDDRLDAGSPAINARRTDVYARPFADYLGNDRATDNPATNNTGIAFAGPVIDISASELEIACGDTPGVCDDIDFNNNGSFFDPCDIDAFLMVFSEGPCTPCGL